VRCVNLFERHDKPWMNGRVRSMPHIGVSDTSSIVREDYTMHGLHLSCEGKKKLTQPIAERVVGGHASGISSIPIIAHARAFPFGA
jgi:hypothetical protein